MAFFDDIGKKISDAGQSTIQKTKDLADTAKYTSQISDEEKKIQSNYTLLGKMYYEETKDNPGDNYVQYITEITESMNRIHDLQNKINDLKGKGRCVNCGAVISAEDTFCAACGHKIEKAEKPAESQANTCPKCGNVLAEGAAFCIYCGNKIETTPCATNVDAEGTAELSVNDSTEVMEEN